MTNKQLRQFIEYLTQQYVVWAPQKINGEVVIETVTDPKSIEFISELPLHSFKKILVPPNEVLFSYENNKIKPEINAPFQAIFGLTVVDLKAIVFLNQIFAKDPYFQERLKKTLIIGQSLVPSGNEKFFLEKFQEDFLEHLRFDIFFAVGKNELKVFTGSLDGQRTLEKFGYSDFEHVEFVGPIKEEGKDPQMLKIRDKFYEDDKIWEDLGKICIECGKCTVICPCCFCFDITDQPGLKAGCGQRSRTCTTCFYTDFSEVAGLEIDLKKPKFLSDTKSRIRFWYEHKFVRCPDDISLPGCVGCGRCTKVCPVGIDIKKNLQRILQGKIK